MKFIHQEFTQNTDKKEWVIIIGNFDGFHCGHQILIKQLLEDKKKFNSNAGIITFDPHPKKVLQPHVPFNQIYDNDQKCKFIKNSGLDACFVISFSKEFSNLSPSEFIAKLFKFIKLKKIIVGYDFNFGKNRQGSTNLLKQEAEKNNIIFHQNEPVKIDTITISSTMIRRLLFEGEFVEVKKYLGRDWEIEGVVKSGKGLGRKIGIPTLNLEPSVIYPVKNGVYAVVAEIEGKAYQAVCNIGYRPTFSEKKYVVEVHLFDFNKSIIDIKISIKPRVFIREESIFEGVDQLTSQIQKDIMQAKHYFQEQVIV